MRRVEPWLVAITAAAALAAGAGRSHAQVRDHRAPPPPPPPADRDHRHPPPTDDVPREAPPPPREERIEARAGFVFITGRWNWRAGKWDWMPGHWERERAGQHWSAGHWDRNGDHWGYVEGNWVAGAAGPPPTAPPAAQPPVAPPPAAPPPGEPPPADRDDHREHREWHLDRPVVSSYWPVKGKAGSRIVIRGRNFPPDAIVLWNGNQIAGAKVEPERIVVMVPPDATSGALALRTSRRDLPIGSFEVANYDADAEARRIADDERRRAEQEWADRQKQIAHDRTARLAAAEQHDREFEASREQRRAEREKEIRAKWEAAFLGDADTQAELTLHAQRVAELARAKEVAELADNGKLVVRITVAQSKEDDRHQARMTALHDAFGRKP